MSFADPIAELLDCGIGLSALRGRRQEQLET